MKIIIHIALLCITSIAFTQEQKKVNQIKVITSWEGRPRCNGGRGLCAINSINNTEQANTIIYYYENNKVDFIIDRAKISKEEEIKIVGIKINSDPEINEFTCAIKEDYILDTMTRTSLKISAELTKIPKGNYPIHITEDAITITFKLE